ncbi:MAG: helix-turn-helix domain-containing protein [Mycolicibacterium cosmeticum]|nr:helix-turn-helix domain-containing protein [Mycolicibacterium cosmeticum]
MARPALSATRSVDVLNFLAANAPEQFTLSDLSGRLDINLASAHALLTTLEAAGYVVRHPRLRSYSLGASVVALGNAALQSHPAIACANDEAHRLSTELELSVAVTAEAGTDIVFLGRMGEHRPRDIAAYAGQRIPLAPPVGAVFVAWGDATTWLAEAPDSAQMQSVLDEVRHRGWAASFEPDHYQPLGSLDPAASYDVVMVTAPVFGPTGTTVVALTLLGLPPHLTADRITYYGEKVRNAGLLATRRSAGRAPGTP